MLSRRGTVPEMAALPAAFDAAPNSRAAEQADRSSLSSACVALTHRPTGGTVAQFTRVPGDTEADRAETFGRAG
jgi:hypothetical protein